MANLKVRVVDCYVYFQKAKEVEFLLSTYEDDGDYTEDDYI